MIIERPYNKAIIAAEMIKYTGCVKDVIKDEPNKAKLAIIKALEKKIVKTNSFTLKSANPKLILIKKLGVKGKMVNKKRNITFCFFTQLNKRSTFFILTNFNISGLLRKYLKILKTDIAPNKLPIQEKRKPLIIPCPATLRATIATNGNIGKKAST